MARVFTEDDMFAALRHAYQRGLGGGMMWKDGEGQETDPGRRLLDELDRLSASEQAIIVEYAHHFAVPADEPVFLLCASDPAALSTLQSYRHLSMVSDAPVETVKAADRAREEFSSFRFNHPERMRHAERPVAHHPV